VKRCIRDTVFESDDDGDEKHLHSENVVEYPHTQGSLKDRTSSLPSYSSISIVQVYIMEETYAREHVSDWTSDFDAE